MPPLTTMLLLPTAPAATVVLLTTLPLPSVFSRVSVPAFKVTTPLKLGFEVSMVKPPAPNLVRPPLLVTRFMLIVPVVLPAA